MTDKETMKQALEALKENHYYMINSGLPNQSMLNKAFTAYKALEERSAQPEQEPVAWQFFEGGKWHNGMEINDHRKHTEAAGVPVRDLYTHPPQRTEPVIDKSAAIRIATALGWTPPLKENT